MADLKDLAAQIIANTRVVSDAKEAKAGKPVTVSVIPGFNPTIPSSFNLAGTSTPAGTLPTISTLAGTLTALITKVEFTVEYSVTDKAGNAVAAGDFTTNPPLPAGQPVPLDVAFLLKPPLGEDIKRTPAIDYVIKVDVTVKLDGNEASTKNPPLQSIKVPVSIPAIGIPSVLVLAQNAFGGSDYPGEVLCMVRSASPLRSLDKVVETLNTVADTISTVKDLLGFTSAVNPIAGMDLILDAFQKATIVYFAVGGAPDFNEFGGWDILGFGGFDEEPSSALMIGVTGTQARLWSSEDFSDSDWHEHSTFTVTDLIPGVGFGFFRNDSFGDWDTDSGDEMDDVESARFL